ncbi:hypothetical protein A0H81_14202 [Grifola frondosa]|uniref:Uncharacterized protein n=1 Tax=Grifola frondosa TaxID=5627 RepID=A0A1C7LML3_GRIFR|nr:hypothetical protein A0H81_14202 [Grifola frondosa]
MLSITWRPRLALGPKNRIWTNNLIRQGEILGRRIDIKPTRTGHYKPLHQFFPFFNFRFRRQSATDTPTAISGLDGVDQLHSIQRDNGLWGRLVRYSQFTPQQPNAAWTCMHRGNLGPLSLPGARQLGYGVRKLWYWFLRQCDSICTLATCELSFQDDVYMQVIEPSNHLLTTRYNNSIVTPIAPGHPRVGWASVNASAQLIPTQGPEGPAFLPHWGRGCSAHRPDVNISNPKKAGLHDFVLLAGPDCDHNLAIAEVKTYWSYSDNDFMNILSPLVCTPQGVFTWHAIPTTTHALIKQIWGELLFYNASWGFATNGRKNWNDPQLHEAMAGMQFAAVDGRVREIFAGQMVHIQVDTAGSAYDQWLINNLCATQQNPY